ncbi:MAG: TadE/TadG family type IV pilus assembly protein [Parasphingopyxis sp.]|nr:pilus assembly protein [Sphingomonadales bacterium]
MNRIFAPLRKLRDDSRGMALTEFGLILVPLMIVLLGAFDLGYQAYVRAVLQGALNDISRTASVESPGLGGSGTIEEQIAAAIEERVDGIARHATYTIEQTNYYEFTGVNASEKLITDFNDNGEYDSGDCFEDLNGNGSFDEQAGRTGRGGADDVVFYEVTVEMPRLVPVTGLIGVPDNYTINANAAIRNQPYANQAEPETVCA